MIEKNQEFEVVIESYGSDGQGVSRINGFVVFVPFALIGEIVRIHIIKVTKSYAVGKVIEIIKPSINRVPNKCNVFGRCGGCALQHSSYNHSLDIKKSIVEDALNKIGGFKNIPVKDVVASKNKYEYRNKASFPLFVNEEGKLEVCMYRTLSHNPVYLENCPISLSIINKTAEIFKNFVNLNYGVNDLKRLKYLVVRAVENKLLIVVVSDCQIKNANRLYYDIKTGLDLSDDALGIYWCKKSKDNNVILEGTIKHLLGIKNISANILGVNVEISPMSFFQVNVDIMTEIYKKVQCSIKKEDVVIDSYSGAGLLSSLIAQKAKHVYGVEIVKEATENANALKRNNNIDNLTNVNGDALIEVPKLIERLKKVDTIILDPPRKGADEKVLKTIVNALPDKIIYISCNPATLARDLKVLCESNYKIEEVEPFDMFPQTSHVETFVVCKKI